jgi:hypothetical protein
MPVRWDKPKVALTMIVERRGKPGSNVPDKRTEFACNAILTQRYPTALVFPSKNNPTGRDSDDIKDTPRDILTCKARY